MRYQKNGSCHCGIYCTKEKAHELLLNIDTKEAIATHFRGLTKKKSVKIYLAMMR